MGALLEQLRAGRSVRHIPVSTVTPEPDTPASPPPGPLLQALRASRLSTVTPSLTSRLVSEAAEPLGERIKQFGLGAVESAVGVLPPVLIGRILQARHALGEAQRGRPEKIHRLLNRQRQEREIQQRFPAARTAGGVVGGLLPVSAGLQATRLATPTLQAAIQRAPLLIRALARGMEFAPTATTLGALERTRQGLQLGAPTTTRDVAQSAAISAIASVPLGALAEVIGTAGQAINRAAYNRLVSDLERGFLRTNPQATPEQLDQFRSFVVRGFTERGIHPQQGPGVFRAALARRRIRQGRVRFPQVEPAPPSQPLQPPTAPAGPLLMALRETRATISTQQALPATIGLPQSVAPSGGVIAPPTQPQPQRVPVKIVRSLVELLPEDVEAVKGAIEGIEAGEAGRRVRTDVGEWIGIPSSFPDYFKNKGYTKKESRAILSNILEGKPVTEKQKAIALDLIAGSRAQLQAEKEAFDAALTSEREQARLEGLAPEQISQAEVAGQSEAQGDLTTEGLDLPPEATEFEPAKLEAEVPPIQQQLPGAEPKLPPGKIQPPQLFQEGPGPLFEGPEIPPSERGIMVGEAQPIFQFGGGDDRPALPNPVRRRVRSLRQTGARHGAAFGYAPGRALRLRFVQTGQLPLVNTSLTSPEDVAFIFGELTNRAQENFFVLATRQSQPVATFHVSIGTVSASLVHPLNVLAASLRKGIDGLWFVHNHPSGDPSPSDADIALTQRFRKVFAATGRPMLKGHIIIEGGRFGFINQYGQTSIDPLQPRVAVGKIPVLSQRIVRLQPSGPVLDDPKKTAAFVKALVDPDKSPLVLIALDVRNQMTGVFPLPQSLASEQLVSFIARRFVLVNARVGILAGVPESLPSPGALSRLDGLLDVVGMKLLDVLSLTPEGVIVRPSGVRGETGAFPAGRVAEVGVVSEGTAGAPREWTGDPLPSELSQESTSVGEPVFGGIHLIRPLQMPEIVRLAKELAGKYPQLSTRLRVHHGLFYSNRGLIKLHPSIFKNPDVAVKVLTHEIGHLIDWLPTHTLKRGNLIGRALSMTYKFMKQEFNGLSNPVFKKDLLAITHFWHPFDETTVPKSYLDYRRSPRELYAEFISVLLNSPVKAKELAPIFYETFFKFLSRKPDVAEEFFALQDLTTGLEEDLLRARENDIREMFQNAEQVFAQKRLQSNQAKKSLWFKLKYELIDKNIAILEKRNAIADKRKLPPESDPAFLVEELSYISSVVKSHLEGFDPIYKKIHDAGLDFQLDFGQYLFLKRVWGERTQIANPLGQIPATAAKQLEFMRQRLGDEKWNKLESVVGETRDWFKSINKLMEEDLLTQEQIATINANTVYAPFQAIQYLQEYVSAGIIHQVGTLGEIANPAVSMFLKAVSMIRTAERNRIQKGIGRFMLQHFPSEALPTRVIQIPGTPPRVQEKEGFGIIKWKEKGKWRAAHVDPFIADSFSYDSEGQLRLIGDVLSKITLNQPVFRPLFITFNLGFQSYNLVRDFLRFWKNTPGMAMPRAFRLYAQSLGPSVRRIRGIQDPLIQQMERESALNITYNDYLTGETNEDEEIKVLMRRFGILPVNKKVWPVFRPIVAVLDGIKFLGDVIETVPKVAGFKALRDLPAKERASMVRNFIGTPNWKRRGRAYAIYNNVFLFSNIIKEGYRGDYEVAFRNPQTRAGFWWKTIKINMLPKIAMWLAALGFFGKAMKDGMDSATEYDKTNYTIIPLGEDGNGETVYLRIPHDETGRFLSGVLWKSLTAFEGGAARSAAEIFSFTGGQLPSLSPAFELGANWYQFLTGRNPRDEFRGRDILTEDELKAGGLYALDPMVRWTINQFGQVHLAMRDRASDDTLLDRALQLTPIINRWIRTSNYGVTEMLRKQAIEPTQRQEARTRLQRNAGIIEAIRHGYPITEALRGLRGRERSTVERKFRRTQVRSAGDPIAAALLQATTNAQKIAVLQKASERFKTSAEFTTFLKQMVLQKVISFEVAQQAKRQSRR